MAAPPFRVAGWTPGESFCTAAFASRALGLRRISSVAARGVIGRFRGSHSGVMHRKGSGLKSICLECDREKARAYYATNRAARLWRPGAPETPSTGGW